MSEQTFELAIKELTEKFREIPMEILAPAFRLRELKVVYG